MLYDLTWSHFLYEEEMYLHLQSNWNIDQFECYPMHERQKINVICNTDIVRFIQITQISTLNSYGQPLSLPRLIKFVNVSWESKVNDIKS